jgi:hypothetical protein
MLNVEKLGSKKILTTMREISKYMPKIESNKKEPASSVNNVRQNFK